VDVVCKNLLQTFPGNIDSMSLEGVVPGCNEQQALYLGFRSKQELVGKHFSELLPKEEVTRLMILKEKVIKEGKIIALEEELTFQQIFHLGKPMDVLKEEARQRGLAWFGDNHWILCQMTIPWQVIRWDNLEKSPHSCLEEIKIRYSGKERFRQILDRFVDEYLKFPSTMENAKAFGLGYIQYECVYLFCWIHYNVRFESELYPNGRNGALKEIYDYRIKPFYPDFLKPLIVRFSTIKVRENSEDNEYRLSLQGSGKVVHYNTLLGEYF